MTTTSPLTSSPTGSTSSASAGWVPGSRVTNGGELRLLTALAPYRRQGLGLDQGVLRDQLVRALEDGRVEDAERAARLLQERAGLAFVHEAVSTSLAAASGRCAAGLAAVLTVRRQATAARTLLERLRDGSHTTGTGLVVLCVPPGEQHTLGLSALAHQLQDAGHPVLVVDDLPEDELAELAADPGTVAVVVSAHVELTNRAARRFFTALRDAAPDVLLVAGGPGMPPRMRAADLVTDDPAELLRALAGRTNPLTEREREVLLAVADGLTNSEIALALHVSPATVKTHLDHVLAKTGTEHRAAAVAHALRQGWIP